MIWYDDMVGNKKRDTKIGVESWSVWNKFVQ